MSSFGKLIDRVAARFALKVNVSKIGAQPQAIFIETTRLQSARKALYELPRKMVNQHLLIAIVPMSAVWDVPQIRFIDREQHYLTRALRAYQRFGRAACLESLEHYYETFQPSNAAEFLGFDLDQTGLSQHAPLLCPMPWNAITPLEEAERRKASMEQELRQHNIRFPYVSHHGYKQFGPVSSDLIRMEADRLIGVYDSIASEGYTTRGYEDLPVAEILSFGPKEVYVLHSGMHRAAALAALNIDTIQIKIPTHPFPVVRVEESTWWPQVQRGLVDKSAAIEFASRFFTSPQSAE